MRLIKKAALRLIGNRLVDEDGNALGLYTLAREFDEILEILEINAFVLANASDIEASGSEPIKYFRPADEPAQITSLVEPSTPLRDEDVAKQKAMALEFLAVQETVSINDQLRRYSTLAEFFANDYVEVIESSTAGEFNGDILSLTEADVIDAVTAFHDPAIAKLRKKLDIQFSTQ